MRRPGVELQLGGLAGGLDGLLAGLAAVGIIDYHLHVARLIPDVVPAQTVAVEALGGVLGDAALALAVDEKFARGVVGVAVDGRHLSDAVLALAGVALAGCRAATFPLTRRPVAFLLLARPPAPVGQQVDGVLLGVPSRAVEPVAVLGQAGQVADAEVARARWPVLVVGGGLAEVVVARPHELADYPRLVVLLGPVVVGQVAPGAVFQVVTRALAVGGEDGLRVVALGPGGEAGVVVGPDGELIHAPAADGRCRLGAEQESLRQLLDARVVLVYAIVESWHVHHLGHAALDGCLGVVETLGDGARGVEVVADVLQPL